MKIYQCDCCKAQVNDFSHWYDGVEPRSLYELKCVHVVNTNVYDEVILCQKCVEKLLYKTDQERRERG